MSRTGVYTSRDGELLWFLLESEDYVSSSDLLVHAAIGPLRDMAGAIKPVRRSSSESLIIRERYRAWSQCVEDFTGVAVPGIDAVLDESEYEEDLYEMLAESPEWYFIGDGADSAYGALDELAQSMCRLDIGSQDIIDVLLPRRDVVDIILAVPATGYVYIIKSESTDLCEEVDSSDRAALYSAAHPVDGLGYAQSAGDVSTYVLSEKTIDRFTDWVEIYGGGS